MYDQLLIRPATSNDEPAVADLPVANNMFGGEELDDFAAAFRGAVNGELKDHRWWVSATDANRIIGAMYLAPEPFADRLWNLYFLAVSPTDHGSGAGTQLIAHVEDELRREGEARARVLIVETSSTDQYEGARRFYRGRGFDEEARIRDFYGPGDNKVVFWKALTS